MPNPVKSTKNIWIPVLGGALVLGGIWFWLVVRWSSYGPWVAPPEAKALANPVAANVANLATGKRVYLDRCARCHGDQGNGDGPDASMYKTPPGVLSDVHIMGRETDGEIFWKISEGRRPMPSFENELNDEQRWQLVDLIRDFGRSAPQVPAAMPIQPPRN